MQGASIAQIETPNASQAINSSTLRSQQCRAHQHLKHAHEVQVIPLEETNDLTPIIDSQEPPTGFHQADQEEHKTNEEEMSELFSQWLLQWPVLVGSRYGASSERLAIFQKGIKDIKKGFASALKFKNTSSEWSCLPAAL